MKKIIYILTIVAILTACGGPKYQYHRNYSGYQQSVAAIPEQVNGERLNDILIDLSAMVRGTEKELGTAGNYIMSVMDESYSPAMQEFGYVYSVAFDNLSYLVNYRPPLSHGDSGQNRPEQPLPDQYYVINDDREEQRTAYNIIGWKAAAKETDQTLVLTAHYDTTGGSHGAYDNASGVAALLELSHLLKDVPLEVNLCFVFFSHEELGMIGSRYYVETLSRQEREALIGNINIDCIGNRYGGDYVLYTSDGMENAASELFQNGLPVVKLYNSDHSSFWGKGIPDVWLSQEDVFNTNANSVKDRYEDLDTADYQQAVELVYQVLLENFNSREN